MQRIFRSFEYVVTDSIGSHVAYAAYCGCKVVLRNATSDFTSEAVLYDNRPDWLKDEEKRPRKSTKEYLQEIAPFLFVSMAEATQQIDWAEKELGLENKKSSEEIAELLGWKLQEITHGWQPTDASDYLTSQELLQHALDCFEKR